jgi:hypothetical protein
VGVSIYYTAKRNWPLSAEERAGIKRVVDHYAVEDRIDTYCATGEGPNWQSFFVYDPGDPTEPDVVFEGATGLPNNNEEAFGIGVAHWCAALSKIRRLIAHAEWRVHIDDRTIKWDEKRQRFDPYLR